MHYCVCFAKNELRNFSCKLIFMVENTINIPFNNKKPFVNWQVILRAVTDAEFIVS